MAMHSTDLLPALLELPTSASGKRMSFRDMIAGLTSTDRTMYAAELASGVSLGMWAVFDRVNVDDSLTRAYATRWPDLAADRSLYEQWQTLADSGEGAGENEWFFSGLKGQLAEFEAHERLEAQGFTNVELAPASNQEGWDIGAVDADGRDVLIQVKTGTSYSASDVQSLMEDNPDYLFALGTELHDKVVASGMDQGGRIVTDVGSDYVQVQGIKDGLETLSANMGIDIPDGVVEIIPYAAVAVGGARLIYSAVKTEMEFKAADRTTKNQIQVVQTLTMMSRMGITTVLATVGGMSGTAAGSSVPGIGNVIGGVGGTIVGTGIAMYLNRHLQPHMLNLALNITGLSHDDLFYFRNRSRIHEVAFRLQTRARELASSPGF